MTVVKRYLVTYHFEDDEPRRVFERPVLARGPKHAEQIVKESVWMCEHLDDAWPADPALNPHRLESLQFIEIKACA
jgi:hypothetical protein